MLYCKNHVASTHIHPPAGSSQNFLLLSCLTALNSATTDPISSLFRDVWVQVSGDKNKDKA